MKFVTAEDMRAIDEATIRDHGVPGEVLMERAGLGVAVALNGVMETIRGVRRRVLVVAGHGNNGGDAFVTAKHLAAWGYSVEVWLAADRSSVGGDALAHLQKMESAGVPLHECPDPAGWSPGRQSAGVYDFVIDGVLGTGIGGAPRGVAAAAIEYINSAASDAFVVAIDIPSGLNADTGEVAGSAVIADLTVTMGLPKHGFVLGRGIDHVGAVEVVDIGIPGELVEHVSSRSGLITRDEVHSNLGRRERGAHKGSFGHVLLVGGAPGYSGAINMAARAALRSGAGLVSAVVPQSIADTITGSVPEVMVRGVVSADGGSVEPLFFSNWERDINGFDAIVMGPGMTTHENTRFLMQDVLRRCKVPLVLDADALNVQRCEEGLLRSATCPLAITPHPAELARFLERDTEYVQKDRIGAAVETAVSTNAVVVLKGAGTVVAAPGSDEGIEIECAGVNLAGNPGMATGGSGDVLAGMVGAIAAGGHSLRDAARAAVYVHGHAGDRVAWKGSQTGLTAGDIIEELPAAFRAAVGR